MQYKTIDAYYEPLSILQKYPNRGDAGMSDYELAFLCGFIKEFRPRKILEIGVAAGGTGMVMMECLRHMDYDCEIHSVDICKKLYIDTSRYTGEMETRYMTEHEGNIRIKHKMYLGNTIGKYIGEIGDGIDFVVLDSMHSLPGELLDLICAYPYIVNNAVVVFHDVGMPQIGIGYINGDPFEYASLTAMIALGGRKYRGWDFSRVGGLANIGAVVVDRESTSLDNMFMGLMFCWDYIPDDSSMSEYSECIKSSLGDEYSKLLDSAIECNRYSLYRRGRIKVNPVEIKKQFEELVESSNRICIYGEGIIGHSIEDWVARNYGLKACFLTTDKIVSQESKIGDGDMVIIGVSDQYQLDVFKTILSNGGTRNRVFPYNLIGMREFLRIVEYDNWMNTGGDIYNNINGYENKIMKAHREA